MDVNLLNEAEYMESFWVAQHTQTVILKRILQKKLTKKLLQTILLEYMILYIENKKLIRTKVFLSVSFGGEGGI